MRCSSVAKTSIGLPGCFAASSATAFASFMEWPAPLSGDVGSPAVQTEEWIMKIAVLGVDLGKNVCSLNGVSKEFFEALLETFAREAEAGLKAASSCSCSGQCGMAWASPSQNPRWCSPHLSAVPYSPELQPAETLWALVDEPIR